MPQVINIAARTMMYDEVRKHRCVKRLILNDYFSVWNCILYKGKQP